MEKGKRIYQVEPWTITETEFNEENNYRNETTFALSNGYIGTRGTFEEAYEFNTEEGLEGNFINGFYESEDIRYGEWNYGFPLKSQSLLNICNGKEMHIVLNGECLNLRKRKAEKYARILHMKIGTVTRELKWTAEDGSNFHIFTERFTSFEEKNVMAQKLVIRPQECGGKVRIESVLNGDVENHTRKTNPLVDYGPFGKRLYSKQQGTDKKGAYYEGITSKSRLSMACLVWHEWNIEPELTEEHTEEAKAVNVYEWSLKEGQELVLCKFAAYTSSLDRKEEAMKPFLKEIQKKLSSSGYEALRKCQLDYMEKFWENADVEIVGDDELQQGLRFNLFHIMQAAGRDGKTGMGAKGLSGEGYEGHYFWDTEMYVLPVFTYTYPELAKKLLDFRYGTLEEARKRARVLGHEKGALYPWRTINGEEASTYFPLGTAQYHINADIAYAFMQYITVTGDLDYLSKAAEVICETARVYADVGCFAECRDGKYCICAVTGPDEYNAIVDNNFYTNLMARENLKDALIILGMLKKEDRGNYEKLTDRLKISSDETELWQKIAENMYFPYDKKRQIYSLDDGFLMRKPWDESKIPPEKRHLLYENYHPLFVYRQRMSKQADAVLGMYLHSNLFTKEELKRNYDFYQEVTLHHSSLSTCIFGIVACEIGYYEEAFRYFMESARMDLDDYHKNFYAGIHAANMAGTWQGIVNGFAGMRTNAGELHFSPYLPEAWSKLRFRIAYKGNVLQVKMKKTETEFTLIKGSKISFYLHDEKIQIEAEGEKYIEKI